MKNLFSFLLLSLSVTVGLSQPLTQTVRGKIVDAETSYPLESASVTTTDASGQVIGTFTNEQGSFRLENVPVGRQRFTISMVSYKDAVLDNIEVTSAKEVILNIGLEATPYELDEVVIGATRNGEASHEMATVSARTFSVTETNLYAGSRGEPARMASNYAGVQGADDSRNDIVIRGNSPAGVLYRLDGVNIPNPNHFAIPGTGGGPVTILNNKFLGNSDFFTGAFPAQFGNGLAGVFDLQMRNGNNQQHEFTGQLGFLGTELTAEGPLNKNSESSYLAMYRYSTLQLFQFLNIDVGSDAVPSYQDGAFRVNLPQKNGASLAIWGMGGLSQIPILLSEEVAPPEEPDLYAADTDRDQYFGSRTGVLAATYSYPINSSTFLKLGVSASHQSIKANHDQIYRHIELDQNQEEYFVLDSLKPVLWYQFRENKYSAFANYKKKFGRQHTLQAGINLDLYDMRYLDSARQVFQTIDSLGDWTVRWDAQDMAPLVQPYVQYKYNYRDKLLITAGLTSLYWGINDNSFSFIEPRVGATYNVAPGHSLNAGAGLHSQIQSPYIYYYGNTIIGNDPQEENLDMGLSKSAHAVLGYDWVLAKGIRFKAEVYYQHLFQIPVEVNPSSFSLLNAGSGFARFFPERLQNTGIGRNYGLELTLERFFASGFYFLTTGSLFNAQYQGSDEVWRNVTFNSQYTGNILGAYELELNNGMSIMTGVNLTAAGGRWYGEVDEQRSIDLGEVIFVDSTVNTLQFDRYFRMDVKFAVRWNRPRVTHELAFDIVNVTDNFNVLTLRFTPDNPESQVTPVPNLGILPLFYYKIDF